MGAANIAAQVANSYFNVPIGTMLQVDAASTKTVRIFAELFPSLLKTLKIVT
jgi:hypothetical protein